MIDRLSPRARPARPPQGYHRWRTLTFVHWRVPEAALRPLVPPALTIDTFEGDAFIGLVLFTMEGIRPSRLVPPLPGVSAFHETNVRTYVHHQGRPGVWFFSLDAANALAVWAARTFFHLPYYRADMALSRDHERIVYRSTRTHRKAPPATVDVEVTLGAPITEKPEGTLEFFLVERYLLFAERSDGALLEGQVHHPPYPLREARTPRLTETVVSAAGIGALGSRTPDWFSEGVDVAVFPFTEVGRARG